MGEGGIAVRGERTLRVAEFDPAVTNYWLAGSSIGLVLSCVGIVVLPVWLLLGKWVTGRYLASHGCELTTRSLRFRKGILNRVEKTVPLDKITDLGFAEGPLMRYFGVSALTIETAGQSGPGALVQLQGIRDAKAFRDAVLEQRDRVTDHGESEPARHLSTAAVTADAMILAEIRDCLLRIETRLEEER